MNIPRYKPLQRVYGAGWIRRPVLPLLHIPLVNENVRFGSGISSSEGGDPTIVGNAARRLVLPNVAVWHNVPAEDEGPEGSGCRQIL